MKNVAVFVIFVLSVLLLPLSLAQEGHMTLLAVSETENGHVGGTADLFLQIEPGQGRVFLETFPFTKVDTQMSTRFANDIACEYTNRDCDQYDFFYTIMSPAPIVAGPSAGAAMTALTIALLEGETLNDDVVVTGTINSGGLIGPVGGINAKITAADNLNLEKALIPKGGSLFDSLNETNMSQSPLPENLSIDVIEVATVEDMMFHIANIQPKKKENLEISSEYTDVMKQLAEELCGRNDRLRTLLDNVSKENSTEKKRLAENLSAQGASEFENGAYYSSASFCYGANIEFLRNIFEQRNFSEQRIREVQDQIQEGIFILDKTLDDLNIKTITDLEAYMIVKERLFESQLHLDNSQNVSNNTFALNNHLAWATERLNSAQSWSKFLGQPGKEYEIDETSLARSCTIKIAEVEQRIQYINEFVPLPLSNVHQGIVDAREEFAQKNYELCLFKASKAKADVGVVLGIFGVRPESYEDVLSTKLDIVQEQLAKETNQGTFPILGYSYFEYSNSLKERDLSSALLYAEYALELGNVDMYFSSVKKQMIPFSIDTEKIGLILIGLAVGLLAGFLIRPKKKRSRKRK